MTTTIAIVGRTNTGKTTLIRTITKGAHGQIDDRAGSTVDVDPAYYSALHARLIDTPGFQEAGTILHLLRRDLAGYESLPNEYRHERLAIGALRSADAVIYLVSVETTPDRSHDKELELVKLANPRVVGVLNKTRMIAAGLANPAKRIHDWEERLRNDGIGAVIRFDAHWDRYSNLEMVYTAIAKLLEPKKRAIFEHSLQAFRKSLAETEDLVAKRAAGCMLACRGVANRGRTDEYGFDRTKTVAELRRKTVAELQQYQTEFAAEVLAAYKIAVSGTSTHPELAEGSFKHPGDRVGEMAKHSAVAGVIGGAIGAALGFLVLGPVGAVAGAKLGAGSGAVVGLGSGSIADVNETITMSIPDKQLREIALAMIAMMWCATHQGFGQRPDVARETFEQTLQFVRGEIRTISHPEWRECTERRMAEWFLDSMRRVGV